MKIFKTKDISALSSEDLKRMRRLAIIKFTVVCIFVAVIIVFQTISWFANSKETTANGMRIQIETDQGYDVHFKAYKYDLRDENYFEITDATLVLNEFDVIFQERNRYAGILLRLEVDGDFENVSSPLPVLRVTRDLSLRQNASNEDIFVSDVTQFHVANDDVCNLDRCIAANSNDDLWENALAYFFPDTPSDSSPSPIIFDNVNMGNSIDLGFTPSNNGQTVLWMFINYDSELVQEKRGNGTVTLNQVIMVEPDCNIIKLITS